MGKSTVIVLKILGANLRNSVVRDFCIPGCDKSEGRKIRLIFIIFVKKFGNDCVPVWNVIGSVHIWTFRGPWNLWKTLIE